MFNNTKINISQPWTFLVLIATGLITFSLIILDLLQESFSLTSVLLLWVVVVGLIVSVSGLVLTKRSSYEVFPTKQQIIGAVINGGLLAVLFVVLVLVTQQSLIVALYLVGLMTTLEFFSRRIFQSRKLNQYRVTALLLTAVSVYLILNYFSDLEYLLALFVGLLIAKELSGRYTRTYLLSPWVNSIWGGLAFVVIGGLSVFQMVPGVKSLSVDQLVSEAGTLPIWVGLLAVISGGLVILMRFIKRKTSIAGGYVQHKVQFFTLLLLGVSILLGQVNVFIVSAFLIMFAAVSVAEASIFPKT